jgi:hypothetical protein
MLFNVEVVTEWKVRPLGAQLKEEGMSRVCNKEVILHLMRGVDERTWQVRRLSTGSGYARRVRCTRASIGGIQRIEKGQPLLTSQFVDELQTPRYVNQIRKLNFPQAPLKRLPCNSRVLLPLRLERLICLLPRVRTRRLGSAGHSIIDASAIACVTIAIARRV